MYAYTSDKICGKKGMVIENILPFKGTFVKSAVSELWKDEVGLIFPPITEELNSSSLLYVLYLTV